MKAFQQHLLVPLTFHSNSGQSTTLTHKLSTSIPVGVASSQQTTQSTQQTGTYGFI
jgi:hypothetical protein